MNPPAAAKARRYLLALTVPIFLHAQDTDSLGMEPGPDTVYAPAAEIHPLTPLFHNPPVAILNDRPFRMDLFVNVDPVEIENVVLLFRTDSTRNFKEIPLEGEYSRYRYIIPKEELESGTTLAYYFLATLKDYRLYAYPKDSLDRPDPFIIDLVPPTKEFFQKRLYD